MKTILSLVALGACAIATPSFAEVSAQLAPVLARATNPDAAGLTGAAVNSIDLTAGSDDTTVTLSLRVLSEDTGDKLGTRTFAIKFSAPLDKDSKEGEYLLGGSPNAGSSAEFVWTEARLLGSLSAPDPVQDRAALTRLRAACEADPPDGYKVATCSEKSFNVLSAAMGMEIPADMDHAFYTAPLFTWRLAGKIGKDTLKYRDPLTFASQSADRTPYRLSASMGLLSSTTLFGREGGWLYVGAGGERSRQYEAASKRNLCRGLTGGATSECVTASFAAPTRQMTSNAFVETRWSPPRDTKLVSLKGFEARAGYDAEEETFGVGASVYLFGDGKRLPTGGIRFSWRSNDDDPMTKDDNTTVRFFIGAPFAF